MEPPTTCCTSCKAAASAEKLEALEKQIEEIKTEMKAQHRSTQHDGPASMVFDAVFCAPVVGASDVDMKGDSEELKKAVADVEVDPVVPVPVLVPILDNNKVDPQQEEPQANVILVDEVSVDKETENKVEDEKPVAAVKKPAKK